MTWLRLLGRGGADLDVEICGVCPQDAIRVSRVAEQVETIPLDRPQVLGRKLELSGDVGELEPSSQALLTE